MLQTGKKISWKGRMFRNISVRVQEALLRHISCKSLFLHFNIFITNLYQLEFSIYLVSI